MYNILVKKLVGPNKGHGCFLEGTDCGSVISEGGGGGGGGGGLVPSNYSSWEE